MSLVAVKRRAEAVKYEGESFEKLDLRSMRAYGSSFTSCAFIECQMDLSDLRTAKFMDCSFHRCEMRLVNLAVATLEQSAFLGCNLEQASFSGAYLRDVMFSECRMAYGEAMFLDATSKGKVEFLSSNLHGSNLDFRDVEPGSLIFNDSNLWGAKVGLACAFWNGRFDERTVRQFVALVARVSQDSRLKDFAGSEYAVVCRAMDGRKAVAETAASVLQGMES